MKNYDSRTFSINDFLEWERNGQLELNPRFQRKSVWTDTGRSFLMDTIIRGLPIPKVFIRQKLNVLDRKSIREVVDGQQRLRTILSFLHDGFKISKKHNPQYGGYYFSQLAEVDENIQAALLNYEISVDLLVNMPDNQVLDVFSRLNSYAVVLNEQEKINANHFSEFKLLADELAKKYYSFWINSGLLSEQKILRMEDVTLVADLLISMCAGIHEKKKIKNFYDLYEEHFDNNIEELSNKFEHVIAVINLITGDDIKHTEFSRIHLFYTLYTAIYHVLYGLPGECRDFALNDIDAMEANRLARKLERVDFIFQMAESEDVGVLNEGEQRFLDYSRRATTDASKRRERMRFIVNLLRDERE